MNERKQSYRRHLPHIQPPGAQYHVVFRLKGSLPLKSIERLRSEREEAERESRRIANEGEQGQHLSELRWGYFERFDALLDGDSPGPRWLGDPGIATIVEEALRYRDNKVYRLMASCIMPNHVHLVMELFGRNDIPTYTAMPLYRVLQSLKRHTALECNKALRRRGAFWQDESYDHVIRDRVDLDRTVRYVLENPVKAGLVQSWEQWPWTYVKQDMS
jgi:putative transposase